uniref:Uncharacterized protein n=1 Tax=Musca domestica TaxID=7370 RepID=A0A1I8N0Y8_MUSDO
MHVHIFLIVISILKSLNADSETEEKPIKCYVCSNDGCDVIEEGQTKFLEECSAGKCFVKEEQHPEILGNFVLSRGCGDSSCGSFPSSLCCECYTDGCNQKNSCLVKSKTSDLQASRKLIYLLFVISLINFT